MSLDNMMQQLYDQSSIGMTFLDAAGKIVDINPIGLNILGYTKDQLIGIKFDKIGPSVERLFSITGNSKNPGLLSHKYHRIQLASGDQLTLKIRTQKLAADDGSHNYVLFFTDVLKYEFTDEEVMSGDLVFQRLAEVAPVGIFLTDVEGNAIFLNKAWQALTGMNQEEGKGGGWRNVIYPDDLEMVSNNWNKYVGSKGIWKLDYRCINKKTNEIVYVTATSAPFLDTHDNIIGYVGTIQDNTHVKKSITELSSLNVRLEKIVVERTQELIRKKDELTEAIEISRIGHWHLDLNGENPEFSWSDRYLEIYEVSKNLKIEDPYYFYQFIHSEDVKHVHKVSDEAIRNAKNANIKYRIITPKGNLKYIWSKIKVEVNDNQEAIKIDGVIQDVTVFRSYEERLKQALEKERELGELKSRFVSMASHEFRTPLSTILSSIELIDLYGNKQKYDSQVKHIKRIESAVENLTRILEDFLSLEQLESDNVDVTYEKCSLSDIINSIKDELTITYKDYYIESSITGGDEVIVDEHLLKNILRNLLSNALKYSPKESLVKVVSNITTDLLSIDVIDNGMGIPPKDQKELFSNFYRASNVSNIEGTGLGLVIVQRYVDLMNGKINFTSKYEKGSTFSILLPQENKNLEQ